jgi:hypothetical protein
MSNNKVLVASFMCLFAGCGHPEPTNSLRGSAEETVTAYVRAVKTNNLDVLFAVLPGERRHRAEEMKKSFPEQYQSMLEYVVFRDAIEAAQTAEMKIVESKKGPTEKVTIQMPSISEGKPVIYWIELIREGGSWRVLHEGTMSK